MDLEKLIKILLQNTLSEGVDWEEEEEVELSEEKRVVLKSDEGKEVSFLQEKIEKEKSKEELHEEQEKKESATLEKKIEEVEEKKDGSSIETNLRENDYYKEISENYKKRDLVTGSIERALELNLEPSQQLKDFFGEKGRYFLQVGFLWSELFGPPVGLREYHTYEGNFFWNF